MAAPTDILNLSDEDFAKLSSPEDHAGSPPSPPGSAPAGSPPPPREDDDDSSEEGDEDGEPAGSTKETPPAGDEGDDSDGESLEDEEDELPPARPNPLEEGTGDTQTEDEEDDDGDDGDETSPTDAGVDYEAFYKRVMAPFKANGRMIELQSPEEVISLMQMGANYTKKMQALQEQRKFLVMLENNELLDEDKLSFLIDVGNKNPEAIKKLLRDAEIDPLEIDTSEDPKYQGGSHKVTDQEASLNAAIKELRGLPKGDETLNLIRSWDETSKGIVYENPEILAAIHTQREEGIFDAIVTEMERLQTLGRIPPTAPFLHAYKQTGDLLASQQSHQPAPQAPSQVARGPVARKAVGSKTKATDTRKVRAAAPPRSSKSKKATSDMNPLALSDEEFQKIHHLAGKL